MRHFLGSRFSRIATAVAGALWLSSSLHIPPASADTRAPVVAAGEGARVIVKYSSHSTLLRRARPTERRDVDTDSAPQLGRRTGLSLRAGRHVAERVQVVMSDGMSSAELAQRLGRESDVEYAVVDQRRRISTPPNDPLYIAGPPLNGSRGGPVVGQWYLRAPAGTVKSSIDVEAAWAITQGSSSVVVAVIDSGVRFDHPDLRKVASGGNLLDGYDFVSSPVTGADGGSGRDADASDPGDYVTQADVNSSSNNGICTADDIRNSSWHGTQTAGLIGATTQNGVGMAGASPRVRVLPVRVLGKCGGFDSDIAAGTLWSAGIAVPGVPANPTPAKVLNLSLGGDGPCTAAYQDVVNQVNARGAVIVASAGNSTGHAVGAPANCTGVIGVAGLRHVGSKVGFSDLGPEIAISAPAGNCVNVGPGDACLYPMLTTTNAGATTPLSDAAGGSTYTDSFDVSLGTSFAAPMVSATVALMFSVQPLLTPADAKAHLQASARPFPTTGGDNGDGTPVTQCLAPRPPGQAQFDQLQCYCTQTTCGAGMLDAGAAVRAAHPIQVDITADLGPPQLRGTPIPLTATASGGTGAYEFKWWASPDGGAHWTVLREWGTGTFAWTPTTASATWLVAVWVRGAGSTADAYESYDLLPYAITTPPPAVVTSLAASLPSPQLRGTPVILTASAAAGTGAYEFKWWASPDGGVHWTVLREWGARTFAWTPTTASGTWRLAVWVRNAGATADTYEGYQVLPYAITAPPPAVVTSLVASLPSPQLRGTPIALTATASGGTGVYEFKWWASSDGGRSWSVVQQWGASATAVWTPAVAANDYRVAVWVRSLGATLDQAEGYEVLPYAVLTPPPLTLTALTPSVPSPQRPGVTITLEATATGGVAPYQFKWWASPDGGSTWQMLRNWGSDTFAWNPILPSAHWLIGAWAREAGSSLDTPEHARVLPYRIRPLGPLAENDFDGDGRSDLPAWLDNGDFTIALLNGAQVRAFGVAATVTDDAWGSVGTRDIDETGTADVVWHNAESRLVYAWLMSGTTIARVQLIGTAPLGLYLVGSGDFDGNGSPDLLWIDPTTGNVSIWLLSGLTVVDSGVVATIPPGLLPQGCIADFDDDGKEDVLYAGPAPSVLSLYLMDGRSVRSSLVLPAPPTGYELIGCGDFSGDRRADVFWDSGAGGSGLFWILDGGNVASTPTISLGGSLRHAGSTGGRFGDHDGDGQLDLVWFDQANGNAGVTLLQGTTVRANTPFHP